MASAPQFFKGDDQEKKFYNSAKTILDQLSLQKDLFFQNSYDCYLLGELIYDQDRAPLTKAIHRDIFRETFSALFAAFEVSGSLESYLTVFRDIFGDDVDIEFTIPGPGKLTIDIEASSLEISNFVARHIEDNVYLFDNVVTQDGDQIVFQSIQGFESQADLEKMLYELVPDGIYTQITLTLAG